MTTGNAFAENLGAIVESRKYTPAGLSAILAQSVNAILIPHPAPTAHEFSQLFAKEGLSLPKISFKVADVGMNLQPIRPDAVAAPSGPGSAGRSA